MNVLALGSLLLALPQTKTSAAYYDVPLSGLELAEGEVLPLWGEQGPTAWEQYDFLWPYAVLEGPGEVVYFLPGAEGASWTHPAHGPGRLLVKTDAPREVNGTLFVPRADWNGMVALHFTIPAARATASETDFQRAELARVERLWNLRVPGAAWFRHRANELRAQLGASVATEEQVNFQAWIANEREGDLSATYGLFSGGRALAENLQLERVLPSVEPGEEKVKLASLEGISVRAFDWKPLVEGLDPELDPLAKLVPADQHALFFPSFEALAAVLDESARLGEFALSAFEERSSDAGTRARLERQLCLELDGLSRALGPLAIESVAITGSDPYLRTGSDVVLLFETKSLPALRAFVVARQDAASAAGAKSVEGSAGGTAWRGVVSRTRAVSSYMAEVGGALAVSNSLGALERIAGVAAGKEPALAAADEYRYFRGRYARPGGTGTGKAAEDGTVNGSEAGSDRAASETAESLLLVLPDAAIRRWCSPRWRIAASRRTRAAAVLADLTAAHADEIARGVAEERALEVEPRLKSLGEVVLTSEGVYSSVYGTLRFLTPISELTFDEVEKREAELYQLWRDGYQSNWSNFFDPIALSLAVEKDRVAADLTVMPLILESEYAELRGYAGSAALDPADGDPHPGALVHFAMALDPESEQLSRYGTVITGLASQLTEPLGWLGGSFSVYLDEDPVWEEIFAAEDPDEVFDGWQDDLNRIPLVLVVEVRSAIKLAAFLTSLRAFVDGTAPGMVSWTEREDAGRRFVEIGASEAVGEDMSLFYATTPKAWILSLQREALLRALDRQKAPPADGAPAETWLGRSVALELSGRGLPLLELLLDEQLSHGVLHNSWSNLPILDEWKRRYPDEDPVQVHQRVFGERLECPGGAGYVWNATWHTMESKVFRHPGEPPPKADLKSRDALLPDAWRGLVRARFGLTFEDEGLRARAEIRRN